MDGGTIFGGKKNGLKWAKPPAQKSPRERSDYVPGPGAYDVTFDVSLILKLQLISPFFDICASVGPLEWKSRPSTLNPQPSTINHQPLTLNPQPSISPPTHNPRLYALDPNS